MFYVNIPKLKGKIAEQGYTKTAFSDRCNINRNTLSSYFKNPEKMPYGVMQRMADALQLDNNDALEIFFTANLTQNESFVS